MKVDILHHCSNFHPLNGNIFNHFEYFIYLFLCGVDVNLVFTPSCDLEPILGIMEDRYRIPLAGYEGHIRTDGIVRGDRVVTNTKVLVDLKGEIEAKEIHLVDTWASYYHDQEIKKYSVGKNIIRYNECSIIGPVNYVRPIYFDLLRKPRYSEEAIYLHLAGVRFIELLDYLKWVLPLIPDKRIILSYPKSQKDQFFYLQDNPNIEHYIGHVPNLFEKFDTYFYILLSGHDYSPRMILESAYLGKKIIHLNRTNNESGYQRYLDAVNGEFEKYRLNENDKLLRNFL